MDAKGLIKGLENWSKRVTTGYKDVNVQNMSSSFKNGLAFCAIIHHYRPDLIDFDSLSKENIFENNSLAFSTAEKMLGVPALLEAKDMEEYAHPDRLSIITYLSQLYNCFENQNKVKVMQSSFKRRSSNSSGPPSKVPAVQPKLLSSNRNDTCYVCNHRVFILERLIVGNKLYHTTCFRCSKCNCLLNPGTYVDSDTSGLYECAVCMPEENSDSMETASLDSFDSKNDSLGDTPVKPVSPLPQNRLTGKSPLSDKVTAARSSFLQHSLAPKSPGVEKLPSPVLRKSVSAFEGSGSVAKKVESVENGASVKAKISVFESNRNSKPESFLKTNELDASSKPKLSCDSSALNGDVPTPRKSLRNIFTMSVTPESKVNGSIFIPDKTSKNSSNVETINATDLKSTTNLSTPMSDIDSPQNDKTNCDTFTSPSILNKVPSPAARRSLLLRSSSTEDETAKKSTSKQIQIGEYKSPLRNSRDIFQANFQPLKLSIPSVNSSTKNEDTSLPNVTSPESVKSGGIEIPQIRSTYARTLPCPGSSSVLLALKDKPSVASSGSESNLTDVLHSKWSRTAPRRSSFDSSNKTIETDSRKLGSTVLTRERTRKSVDNSTIKGSTDKKNSYFQRDQKNTPIPSVRRSLENKNLGLGKPPSPPSEVDSPSQTLNSSSQKLHPKVPSDLKKVKIEVDKVAEPEKVYPVDLNPFGDDDEEEEEYPDDLNPFGDDEEDVPTAPSIPKTIQVEDYDETKNPFASDDEDNDATPAKPTSKPPRPAPPQTNSPFQRDSSFTSLPSPTGTLKGTMKKRLAPKPPRMSDIFPNDSPQDSEADVSLNSLKSSPALSRRSLQTPSPKLRKNKPAPPPPPMPPGRQASRVDPAASSKQLKEADNMKLKSSEADPAKQAKAKKKRPAPPVPIPKRKDNKKIPLKEILREMKDIEEKQRECERQGREIELLIRDRDKDEEPSIEEEEFIMQLFELVNQKNALFRRQAELMYIKRSQRLEEQQSDIETQIRQLMQKPEEEKTDEDRAKEEELILELKDIVDQRSSIIDSIEMDRRRELEEDASVQEQIEIKNGDLPITAEIKEKSSGKTKKFKLKKEKKKKNQENESGEPKKKEKKKWLSK